MVGKVKTLGFCLTLVCASLLVATQGACEETRGALGDECLRSEDCLSGICSGRSCVAKRETKEYPTRTSTPEPEDGGSFAGD
jgi:hypothetical protein